MRKIAISFIGVVCMILLLSSVVWAANTSPKETTQNFLQAIASGNVQAAEKCLLPSIRGQKDQRDQTLVEKITDELKGQKNIFQEFKLLENPKITDAKPANNGYIVGVTYAFEVWGACVPCRVWRKAAFYLQKNKSEWSISNCEIRTTKELLKSSDGVWLTTEEKKRQIQQASNDGAKMRVSERKRKERAADELRPQDYVRGIKTKYIPLMYEWSKDKVEKVLGKVPNPNHNQWNYEFAYLCEGRPRTGGVLDITFIDNRVYKVMARSSSIGSTFSANTLDPQLSKIKFNHIVGDPGFVNYNTGQSLIFITTGTTLFAAGNGKIKPEDTKVSIVDLGSYIFVYYEVPPYWRGIDLRYGTDLDN